MRNIVISYFNRTALVSSVDEAVDFINSLKYRGNSYNLSCSDHCRRRIAEFLQSKNVYASLTTTGCSTTKINLYLALADTLEGHNKIVADNKAKAEKEKAEKDEIAYQEWLTEARREAKGWYVVTLDVLVSKIRGNDGIKTYSFKVLATSEMNAYELACDRAFNDLDDRNVSFVYRINDDAMSALIEYVGEWTDESELEYGGEK